MRGPDTQHFVEGREHSGLAAFSSRQALQRRGPRLFTSGLSSLKAKTRERGTLSIDRKADSAGRVWVASVLIGTSRMLGFTPETTRSARFAASRKPRNRPGSTIDTMHPIPAVSRPRSKVASAGSGLPGQFGLVEILLAGVFEEIGIDQTDRDGNAA